jgi:hypothetical protein
VTIEWEGGGLSGIEEAVGGKGGSTVAEKNPNAQEVHALEDSSLALIGSIPWGAAMRTIWSFKVGKVWVPNWIN